MAVTDPEAFVHVGAQTWHPVEIAVDATSIRLKGTNEERPCVVIGLIPPSGNMGHWLALSFDDAARLRDDIITTLNEVS